MFASPLLLFGVSANTGRIALFKPAVTSATSSNVAATSAASSSTRQQEASVPPPIPLRVSFTLESFAESGLLQRCPEEGWQSNSGGLDESTSFAVFAAAQASQEEAAKREGCSVRVPGRFGEMLATALGGPSGVAALTFHLQTTLAASSAVGRTTVKPTTAKSRATTRRAGKPGAATATPAGVGLKKQIAREKHRSGPALATPGAPRFSLLENSESSDDSGDSASDEEDCEDAREASATTARPQPVVTSAHAIVHAVTEVKERCYSSV